MKHTILAIAILGALTSSVYADNVQTTGDISGYGGGFHLTDKYDSARTGSGGTYGGAVRINS